MRKQIFTILTVISIAALTFSCGAQKKSSNTGGTTTSQVSEGGPSAAQWRSGVRGTWVLSTVDREDIPAAYTIKNIFDEAPVECFIGSVWYLPGGNHRGNISFRSEGTLCANGAVRNIVWSIHNPGKNTVEEPQFQFKKVYAGDKPANVTNGYRLDLSYADENSLVMRMPIALDNGYGHLVFNFTKLD